MKKIFTVTLFSLFAFDFSPASAQLVTIPDQYFADFLNRKFPGSITGGNQLITQSNAVLNATSMGLWSWDSHPNDFLITDITGIEHFKNLGDLGIQGSSAYWLTSLPTLPPNLKVLQCNWNKLTSLPALPASLQYLVCDNNYTLTSLPALFSTSLIQISATDCALTSLPALPSSLKDLYCYRNKLTSLPTLPSSLRDLRCYDNKLTSLPALPSTLSILVCSQNQLSDLPVLPNSLTSLQCGGNLLSKLPALPNSCKEIFCSDNLLAVLPPLPDSLMWFDCSNNINLTCLPPVTTFINNTWSFQFFNTGITCLPNKILHPNIANFPRLDTMPICSPKYDIHHCVFGKQCDPPAGTYVSNITRTRVRLNWDTIPSAERYRIHYRPLGSTAWTTIIVGSNIGHKPVTGLTRNTTYEWKINTVCSTSPFEQSKSSAIQTFSTHFRMEDESAEESAIDFNVYPNPANDKLTIDIGELTTGEIKIKNILSQTVFTQSVSSVTKINIDVSDLSPGIYFLHFHSANGDVVKKMVKQ